MTNKQCLYYNYLGGTKMEKIIREAYLSLIENVQQRKSEKQLLLEKEEEDFYCKLDEDGKKLFIELSDIHTAQIAEAELAFFKEGVKLGMLLTMEVTLT